MYYAIIIRVLRYTRRRAKRVSRDGVKKKTRSTLSNNTATHTGYRVTVYYRWQRASQKWSFKGFRVILPTTRYHKTIAILTHCPQIPIEEGERLAPSV